LKRQDEQYFGGLREAVLKRDDYRCRARGALVREKRSIIVHHRVPGVSESKLMISLCPGCHAKVERTKMVLAEMNPLLLELWREQHPEGQEQITLAFSTREVTGLY
jgi:5-methylcytosine-specific restriction endonuclease McrA